MDSYVPVHAGRQMYHFGTRDQTSLPNRPGDFTFRAQDNSHSRQGPRFPQQSHPLPPRPPRRSGARANHNDNASTHSTQARPRRAAQQKQHPARGRSADRKRQGPPRRPWIRKPPTSDRPLLRNQRAPTPEQLLGMNEGESRFKALEALSDSDEQDMELDSEAEGVESRTDEPPPKRLHLSSRLDGAGSITEQPKWSNPDPYTSLPPPDESKAKRKDVVKLIRKAKATATGSKTTAADGEDFISFDMDNADDDFGNASEEEQESDTLSTDEIQGNIKKARGVPEAPTGPRINIPMDSHAYRNAPGTSSVPISIDDLGPPPPLPDDVVEALDGSEKIDMWPPPPPPNPGAANGTGGNKRKRARDEASESAGLGNKRAKHKLPVDIVPEWVPKKNKTSTPWLEVDHSDCENMGVRLHKEICDFYEYVRPRDFEHEMRHALIRRVSRFVRDYFRNAEVACFGSFAAGTYLPDADMDLVVLSSQFRQGGPPSIGQNKKQLFSFAGLLQRAGIAKPASTTTIWKAKVPIVKYVDSYTGLRCDISFENNTGIIANHTNAQWKVEFPAMPIIVSIIKHFLLMRGMNEVHTGGLGSFAINCLVISLMQHMPQITSGNMDPTKHLGEILMHFLDFYGNKFNKTTTGISINPPRYFPKHPGEHGYQANNMYKLSILDPNKPDNDISSGTTNVNAIFETFSTAFKTLKDRMNELRAIRVNGKSAGRGRDSLTDTSILGSLYAGDYESFDRQRERMRMLYTER